MASRVLMFCLSALGVCDSALGFQVCRVFPVMVEHIQGARLCFQRRSEDASDDTYPMNQNAYKCQNNILAGQPRHRYSRIRNLESAPCFSSGFLLRSFFDLHGSHTLP